MPCSLGGKFLKNLNFLQTPIGRLAPGRGASAGGGSEPGHFIGHAVKPYFERLRIPAVVDVIERRGEMLSNFQVNETHNLPGNPRLPDCHGGVRKQYENVGPAIEVNRYTLSINTVNGRTGLLVSSDSSTGVDNKGNEVSRRRCGNNLTVMIGESRDVAMQSRRCQLRMVDAVICRWGLGGLCQVSTNPRRPARSRRTSGVCGALFPAVKQQCH